MIKDFIAGDTVRFTQHYTDYPSSDYTSVLYFNIYIYFKILNKSWLGFFPLRTSLFYNR